MKFKINRASAKFGTFNARDEKNVDGHAFDLPFTMTTTADVLEVVLPAEQEGAAVLKEVLFSSEGVPLRPYIGTIKLSRKPEGVDVTIWDKPRGNPLVLKGCNIKDLAIELATPHEVRISGKVQHSKYTDSELSRVDKLMGVNADLAMEAAQDDMFEDDSEDD